METNTCDIGIEQKRSVEMKRKLEFAEKVIALQESEIDEKQKQIDHLHEVAYSMRLSVRIRRVLERIVPKKLLQNLPRFPDRKSPGYIMQDHQSSYAYLEPSRDKYVDNTIYRFDNFSSISILLPIKDPQLQWMESLFKILEKQWYPYWELCIVVEETCSKEVVDYLESVKHGKIKVTYVAQSSSARELLDIARICANGEYSVLLDQGSLLTVDALYEVVKKINEDGSELLYSDEDRIDSEGKFVEPFFKPDFSYDLLLAYNYIGGFLVIRSEIMEGNNSYEILLNALGKTDKIAHIPKILYHRKELPKGPGKNEEEMRMIEKYLEAKHIRATVKKGELPDTFDIEYALPDPDPLVSIIIPTRDHVGYLDDCINSIIALSSYRNIEILILNNNSREEETFRWFETYQRKYSFIKVLEANYEFNWAKLNNQGIRAAQGEVYIFLNNDIKVITPGWIERLASRALLPGVGTVGALLLFEDDTIQHAGVVVGLSGWADHIYRGSSRKQLEEPVPFVSPLVNRNVLASTGACLAISRQTIEDIGGFDEKYIVAHSDVEISLRAYEKGYRNIFDAGSRLYHYESKTRSSFDPECDLERSRGVYQYYWDHGDPFYNQNLSIGAYHPNLA